MKSATTKFTNFVRKWSGVPNLTGSVIWPRGTELWPGRMPQNWASYGFNCAGVSLRAGKLLRNKISIELPPSTSTRSNLTLLMHGSRINGKRPGSGMAAHWSCLLKEMSRCDHGGNLGSVIEPSALSTFRQALLRSFLSRFNSIETFHPKMECTTSVGLMY